MTVAGFAARYGRHDQRARPFSCTAGALLKVIYSKALKVLPLLFKNFLIQLLFFEFICAFIKSALATVGMAGAESMLEGMMKAANHGWTAATLPPDFVLFSRQIAYCNAYIRCRGQPEDCVADGDRAGRSGRRRHPSHTESRSPIDIAIPLSAGSGDCCAALCRRRFSPGGPGAGRWRPRRCV